MIAKDVDGRELEIGDRVVGRRDGYRGAGTLANVAGTVAQLAPAAGYRHAYVRWDDGQRTHERPGDLKRLPNNAQTQITPGQE